CSRATDDQVMPLLPSFRIAPTTPPRTTPPLHDALPISHLTGNGAHANGHGHHANGNGSSPSPRSVTVDAFRETLSRVPTAVTIRSEEHTSELQSHLNLVCRLLLEKKPKGRTTRLANEL